MKLINIALLSTALAVGMFSASLPSYADEIAEAVAVEVIGPDIELELPLDDLEVVDKSEPMVIDDSEMNPGDETVDFSASSQTDGEPALMTSGPRGTEPHHRTLTGEVASDNPDGPHGLPVPTIASDNLGGPDGLPVPTIASDNPGGPDGLPVILANNSSNNNGATNAYAMDQKPRCKRGFFKCVLGIK